MVVGLEAKICEAGTAEGLIFPASDSEHSWPPALRAILYGICLVYWFQGVAIVADIFMGSIEKITSKLVQSKGKDGSIETGKLWNETVATLTLMALGSSAPEIFLAIIDVTKRGFHAGELGPPTIVGSAAFNLLMIIAVCVWVIPNGESRSIANRPAFYVTAAFSFGAYLWMFFTLAIHSPDVVEIWEAIMTGALLPIFVFVSFLVDKGYFLTIFEKLGLLGKGGFESEEDETERATVKFAHREVVIPGKVGQKLDIIVKIMRKGPSENEASVNYHTEPLSAVTDYDFQEEEGQLDFAPGQKEIDLTLTISSRPAWRSNCKFLVVLDEPEGDVEFDPNEDGGEDCTMLTVQLEGIGGGGRGIKGLFDRLIGVYNTREGLKEWGEQCGNLMLVGGSIEEHDEASRMDRRMHLLCLPWKIAFLFIPPSRLLGGWLTFFGSLVGIAGVTAGVSDLAEMFGCVVGLPDIVTAITFVALGTSMPDLFASLSAAQEDPTADASIVNVTGSNSVNVFLGLGLPWTIAAFYWKLVGDEAATEWRGMYPEIAARYSSPIFVVKNKDLGFSVVAFGVVCIAALIILHYRRSWLGGELGGPWALKVQTALLLGACWLGWVGIVSWRVMASNGTAEFARQAWIVQGVSLALLVLGVVGLLLSFKIYRSKEIKRRSKAAIQRAEEKAAAQSREADPTEISKDFSKEDAGIEAGVEGEIWTL